MHQWLTAPEKQFGSSIQVLLFDLMRGIGIAARPDDSRANGAGLRTSRSSLSIRTLRSHGSRVRRALWLERPICAAGLDSRCRGYRPQPSCWNPNIYLSWLRAYFTL